jgi:hypothetical protein
MLHAQLPEFRKYISLQCIPFFSQITEGGADKDPESFVYNGHEKKWKFL